jgi:hypothetical protein
MQTELEGTLARLPDGQLVRIEIVHDDGFATVRRIDGDRAGTFAVCQMVKLQPVDSRHKDKSAESY